MPDTESHQILFTKKEAVGYIVAEWAKENAVFESSFLISLQSTIDRMVNTFDNEIIQGMVKNYIEIEPFLEIKISDED